MKWKLRVFWIFQEESVILRMVLLDNKSTYSIRLSSYVRQCISLLLCDGCVSPACCWSARMRKRSSSMLLKNWLQSKGDPQWYLMLLQHCKSSGAMVTSQKLPPCSDTVHVLAPIPLFQYLVPVTTMSRWRSHVQHQRNHLSHSYIHTNKYGIIDSSKWGDAPC